MKYIVLKGAVILTGLLSFNLFAQSAAPTDEQAIIHEVYFCTKEDSGTVTYQLFKPGLSDEKVCELHTYFTDYDATVRQLPSWYATRDKTFCSHKLAQVFLKKIRAGYVCGPPVWTAP